KPVEARELLQTIADLCAPPTELLRRRDGAVLCEESKLPAARTAGADGAVVQTAAADLDPPADVVLDRDALLRRVDRDMNFLGEMVQLFDSTSPQHLDEIREALAQADATRVSRAAHTFKGSVSTFGAGELIRAISELEESARAGDLNRAAHCFCGVEQKYPPLSAALAALMEEP